MNERTPEQARFRRLRSTGAMVLYRVCAVCGKPWVPFGVGFNPPVSLGVWYCAEHLPKKESR